jgi:cytoskeletal protein CcmA (bactofilin family)
MSSVQVNKRSGIATADVINVQEKLIMHRNAKIQSKLQTDCLIFISPSKFYGGVTIDDLTITGSITTSDLIVTGSADIAGKATVGELCSNGAADIAGNVTMGGTASVTGKATVGELCSNGAADIAGNVTMGGTASVTGKATVGELCSNGDADITGNVTVGGNEHVNGDLEVCGKIINPCLDIHKWTPAPPSQDVYDQYLIANTNPENWVMEQEIDVSIPLADRLPGVYGYIGTDFETPVVDGGDIYAPEYTSADFKMHLASDDELVLTTPSNYTSWLNIVSDFYTARGFSLSVSDFSDFNENHYTWSQQNGGNYDGTDTSGILIDIKFVYDSNIQPIPIAVDLVSVGVAPEFTSYPVGNYQPDESLREPKLVYPLRVPITRDCDEYSTKVKAGESIVFYNSTTQQITFNVVNEDFLSGFDPDRPSEVGEPLTGVPIISGPFTAKFSEFKGRFQLSTRSRKNEIIPSNFAKAQYLIQVSNEITCQCTTEWIFWNPDTSFSISRVNDDGAYVGAVMIFSGYADPSTDVYGFPGPVNGFATISAPFVSVNDGVIGDNPNTEIVEAKSQPGPFTLFDNKGWFDLVLFLTESFIDSPDIPENAATFPPALEPTSDILMAVITGHEMAHLIQLGSGDSYSMSDGEGQAVGLEMDIGINKGTIQQFRSGDFSSYVARIARGGSGGVPGLFNEVISPPTYGSGMFWNWLAKTYDPLHQVLRRSLDLVAYDYFKIINDDLTTQVQTLTKYNSPAAFRLYLDRALQEIHGLNLVDIWRDFSISLSLIRNNSSIPSVYQSKFPYWTQQTAYADNTKTGNLWWEEFDTNAPSAGASSFQTVTVEVGGTVYEASLTISGPVSVQPMPSITFPGELTVPGGACDPVTNDLTGKIGIIDWNECNTQGSGVRVLNTEAAGCEGSLIISQDEVTNNYAGSDMQTKVCMIVSNSDGQLIKAYLDTNPDADVTMALSPAPALLDQISLGYNETLDFEDLGTQIYVVDKDNVNTVTVLANSGNISATMHQYTSAGVPNDPGTFNIVGPIAIAPSSSHVFDVSSFTDSGLVRLVVTQLSVTDYSNGGTEPLNNIIIDSSISKISGNVTITSSA